MTCIFIWNLWQKWLLIIVLCAFYCLFVQVYVKGPLDLLDPAGAGSRRGKWGWGTSDYYWATKPFSIIPSSSTPPPSRPFLVEIYPSPAVSCLSRTAIFSFSIKFLPAAFWIKSTFFPGLAKYFFSASSYYLHTMKHIINKPTVNRLLYIVTYCKFLWAPIPLSTQWNKSMCIQCIDVCILHAYRNML